MKYISKSRANHKRRSTKTKDSQIKELHTLINRALSLEDYDEAESLALKLSKLSKLPETSMKYAHLLYLQRKYDKSCKIYLELLPNVKNNIKGEVLFGLGQAFYEIQDFTSSYFYYTLLVNAFTSFIHLEIVYMKLAKIMILFNEVDAASAYCQKVINLNLEKVNNKSEALALIAHIQVIKGNKSEAFELFKELLKTPASTQSLKIAIIDLIQLNPRLAEAVCKKVIKRDIELREWHRVYFLLACCYVKIGEYQKGTRIFEEIEKFEPGIYLVQEFHAISLFYHGEKKESLMKFMMIKNRFPFDVVNSSNFDMVFENLQGAMKGQSSLDVHSNAGNCRNGQDCQKLLVPNLTIFGFPCSEA